MNKEKRLSWDEYFIQLVKMVGKRATCDRGRSGCVIVRDKRIISTGYVGAPMGLAHCDESGHEMHHVVNPDGKETEHCIRATHAEQNAIVNAARFGTSLDNSTLYCTMTPCYVCGKMIVNAGIKRVVCEKDYQAGGRTKEIFQEAGIIFDLLNEQVNEYPEI